jgi:putative two-component system response regulator
VPRNQTLRTSHEVREGAPLEAAEKRPVILVVEQTGANRSVLRATLRAERCHILEAEFIEEARELLAREAVDLVILDLALPAAAGLNFCREIKTGRRTRLIPVLMLASAGGTDLEIAGISSGADEFLVRPLNPAIVRARIRAMLRQKAAVDTLEEAESILFALARAVEQRDKAFGGHCERLAAISLMLGTALGLPRSQLLALHRGGFLHDIGKIAIPDAILFKPGPLDDAEWTLMRAHTVKGEDICRGIRALEPVLPIIRHHHERWDGSGYPDGLSGERIPLLARILQVADVYDALTSVRPYKRALSPAEALAVLDGEARRGWRDPRLVGLLHKLMDSSSDADAMARSLENMRRALLE